MDQRSAGVTATGHVREHNEDDHHVADDLWVVADGLGGLEGGEVASRLAVRALAALLAGRHDVEPGRLASAVRGTHELVVAGGRQLGTPRMGTTLVAAAPYDGQLALAWVGDSRAYVLREGRLRRLTTDHNEAQELLQAGQIRRSTARHHPGRHLLTRALGCGRRTAPDVDTRVVPAVGRLLLCTDGLHGELPDRRIAALLAGGSAHEAAQRLVDAALEAGGRDNVTVVVADLDAVASAPATA